MKDWIEIITPMRIFHISPDGREFHDHIHEGVKKSDHTNALVLFVQKLRDSGINKMNCDHVPFDFLDRGIDLRRGDRRLDVVYYKDGRMYECELKSPREVGLNRTWEQVKDMAKLCDTLTFVTATSQVEKAKEYINLFKLTNVVVDVYDN